MSETSDQIKAMIEERFIKVALDPAGERTFPVGPESARRLGYAAAEIDALPPRATESFAGVGNPLALGDPRAGEVVLDLGCGAGMDSILAAHRVGPTGRVIGVDMTGPMIEKARANASAVEITNVEFHRSDAGRLPVGDRSVDVVISNGVFNLCPDKPRVLAEIFRVLRPGGRLQMADVLLDDGVTPEQLERMGTWSDWIAGAVWERSLLQMLAQAGFVEPTFHGWTGYFTSRYTQGGLITARKPGEATAAVADGAAGGGVNDQEDRDPRLTDR